MQWSTHSMVDEWFAPGVGVVKRIEDNVNTGQGWSSSDRIETVLIAFSDSLLQSRDDSK